jgi:hypothetical protein
MKFSKHFDLILRLGQELEPGWVFGERKLKDGDSVLEIGLPETHVAPLNDQEFESLVKNLLRSVDYSVNSKMQFYAFKQPIKHRGTDKKKTYIARCILYPPGLN